MRIKKVLEHYNYSKLIIGVLGSHSALDICRGAKNEGLRTLVICQTGREKVYRDYYRAKNEMGCVDDVIILPKFADLLSQEVIVKLQKLNTIFIPHRSFEVYLDSNYQAIENDFVLPMFGNRYLLKIEERRSKPNQYNLLEETGIHYPKQFKNPKDIDRLCLVKVLEKERGFERAFFLAESYQDYQQQVETRMQDGSFTEKELENSIIEEFIVGVTVNFNFFYSPLGKRLELLGTDARRQTNLEGILRIPAAYQQEVLRRIAVKYEEVGHVAVTILESLLEDAFEIGEKFVKATQKLYSPGIIGPFALQTIITPGPPKKDIIVVDVSPRVPGSPGISMTPYSSYLFGKPVSVGKRIAMEIKQAVKEKKLIAILT